MQSVLDLFTIGIGPSSSHTVGPMKAAKRFMSECTKQNLITNGTYLKVDLYGSLALTGKGHGTDKAIQLGLMGLGPEDIDSNDMDQILDEISRTNCLKIQGGRLLGFDPKTQIQFHMRESLPQHPNGMKFQITFSNQILLAKTYYSVGGGFIVEEGLEGLLKETVKDSPHEFHTAKELLTLAAKANLSISDLIKQNELAIQTEDQLTQRMRLIWKIMQDCCKRGMHHPGNLPGILKVKRRAPNLYQSLIAKPEAALQDPLSVLDWVNLYAIAVSEENANNGRMVTAPTNGAAGIIPAVLHYYDRFCPHSNENGVFRFLLTSGAIGWLYKKNASISGAEVGCQGEIGVACSMAAAGLAEVLGGTPMQVENAAEIAMEHNLGLTCDPVGGLVQIPCIERNAIGAVKAINAARMALRGDGHHYVSLDQVIETMRQTGLDMTSKYKETSQGGLAVNLAVNVVEC